jgi:hypothetical protein
MSKHTPGPWYCRPVNHPDPEVYACYEIQVDSDGVFIDEAAANARLIAAAPEMLSLLKRLRVWICIDERASDCKVTWDEYFAVIAKAEGLEPRT